MIGLTPKQRGLLLGLILAGNALLNARVFLIPHANGDQRLYVGLAMKLENGGMSSYNLHEIGLKRSHGFLDYTRSATEPTLLTSLEQEGLGIFYNQPLFHQPPLFGYSISASHRFFAAGKPYRVLTKESSALPRVSPADRFFGQYYACIVPFACNLILVAACFLLGKFVFGDAEGLVAALLLSISPAFILASQRIWADTMLGLLVTLTFLFFHLYVARGQVAYLLLSAVSLGLALLVKNSAVLIVPPLAIAWVCVVSRGKDRQNAYLGALAAILIVGLLTLPWYCTLTKVFGTPWFMPTQPAISKSINWSVPLKARPWYTYLVGIPYQTPVYVLGYGTIISLLFRRGRNAGEVTLLLWFIFSLVSLTYLTATNEMLAPEYRYMLPAYPALAVLSAAGLERGRAFFQKGLGPTASYLLAGIILLFCAHWSLGIAAKYLDLDDVGTPF